MEDRPNVELLTGPLGAHDRRVTNQRIFGSSGRRVAAVGQGSWRAEQGGAQALAALRRGLDLGLTHIDTAEMYGAGAAESLVGAAIDGRRDEVFLVSKVLPGNASKRGTIAACEKSLARLGTDRLDCYLLHWRGSHPLAETVAAFDALVATGKILAWGVSNFDVADLEELERVGSDSRPTCNQVLYHVGERYVERGVIPWCSANGLAVVAYTPFGERPEIYTDHIQGRVLQRIASQHDASPRQVALAFLLRNPAVFVIPKASTKEHVAENAAAASLYLTPENCMEIESAFAGRAAARALPMI